MKMTSWAIPALLLIISPGITAGADGLTLEEEIKGTWGACTDPNKADTDDDGILDPIELFSATGFPAVVLARLGAQSNRFVGTRYFYKTDPTRSDTDNDGVPDGFEVYSTLHVNEAFLTRFARSRTQYPFCTDPTNPDTDGDGTIDGLDSNPTNPCVARCWSVDATTFWQQQAGVQGLATTALTDATSDPDHDGISNIEEIYQGTSPIVSNGLIAVTTDPAPFVIRASTGVTFELTIPVINRGSGAITCSYSLVQQPWFRVCDSPGDFLSLWRGAWRERLGWNQTPSGTIPTLQPRAWLERLTSMLRCGMSFPVKIKVDTRKLRDNATYQTTLIILAPFDAPVYTNSVPILLEVGAHPARARAPAVPRLVGPPDGWIATSAYDNIVSWTPADDRTTAPVSYDVYLGTTPEDLRNQRPETQLVNQTALVIPKMQYGCWTSWKVVARHANGLKTHSDIWNCAGPSNLPVFATSLAATQVFFTEAAPYHVFSVSNAGQGPLLWSLDLCDRRRDDAAYVTAHVSRDELLEDCGSQCIVTLRVKRTVVCFEEPWRLRAWCNNRDIVREFVCCGYFPSALADDSAWLLTPRDGATNVAPALTLRWDHPGLPDKAYAAGWSLYLGTLSTQTMAAMLRGGKCEPPRHTNGIFQYCSVQLEPQATYYWYAATVLTNGTTTAVCETPLFMFTTGATRSVSNAPVARTPILCSPPATFAWDVPTILYFMSVVKPASEYSYTDKQFLSLVTNVAAQVQLPAPRDAESFVEGIFALAAHSNDWVFYDFIGDITNATVAELLITHLSNAVQVASALPRDNPVRQTYAGHVSACCSALRAMGTPALLQRANAMSAIVLPHEWSDLNFRVTPSPDRFPRESRAWLLNSDDEHIQSSLLYDWRASSCPETPEVLRAYADKLATMPTNSLNAEYYAERQETIFNLRTEAEEFVRKYQRWLGDDQRGHLHSGGYGDDGWLDYRRRQMATGAQP